MVIATELKTGTALRVEGQVYKVLEVEAKAGAAKLGGVVKTKLTNVISGRLWEPHFRPQERLEDLELERRNLEFLYSDHDASTFVDPNTFEQIEVPLAVVGPSEKFLQPGMQLPVEFSDGSAISVVFPGIVEAGWLTPRLRLTPSRTAHSRRRPSTMAFPSVCRCSSGQATWCG
ncbi:MAG: hypothetical protein P4M04_06990 [Acidobacteriota bacterium]|nr:hypothetical protein [Acidobacteriota bacterium]